MIALRPFERADAYPLWLWANDPATRRASGDRAEIAWDGHRRWLEAWLASDAAVGFVAMEEDRPVGSIRFDTQDRWATARLSYVIAPEARGRGLGGELLRLGCERLLAAHPGAELEAQVRGDNEASARLFRRLGWRVDGSAASGWTFRVGPGAQP
ncbi:MAG: GNAT family N-acetyltransferase [Gemmatimonadales bacterium]